MMRSRGRSMWKPEKVKELRNRFGETQEAFAARLGVGVGTLRDWEQGARRPKGSAAKLLELLWTQSNSQPILA